MTEFKRQKTVQVYDLVNIFNKKIETAKSTEERLTLCSALEGILHMTGNYRGFQYLDWGKGGGYDRWMKAGCPDFPEKNKYIGDQSKRSYFMADGLQDHRNVPGKGYSSNLGKTRVNGQLVDLRKPAAKSKGHGHKSLPAPEPKAEKKE